MSHAIWCDQGLVSPYVTRIARGSGVRAWINEGLGLDGPSAGTTKVHHCMFSTTITSPSPYSYSTNSKPFLKLDILLTDQPRMIVGDDSNVVDALSRWHSDGSFSYDRVMDTQWDICSKVTCGGRSDKDGLSRALRDGWLHRPFSL